MKVILHGATDYGSSNYGDFLYGKIIYDFLVYEMGIDSEDLYFYEPSGFFKRYIDKDRKLDLKGKVKNADIGIYIPGGYFGEGHNASWKENLLQMKRFIPFGIKCVIHRKPFAIIGVGAGPNDNVLFRKLIKCVGNHAEVITVRDKESYEAMRAIGCDRVVCCSDAIIAVDINKYDTEVPDNIELIKILEKLDSISKKGILVHFNHSKDAAEKFGFAVKRFIENNDEYYPIISTDQLLEGEDEIVTLFEQAYKSKNYLRYKYDDPYKFGGLISQMSMVLTAKLHVGVTAVVKGIPTLAVAVHPEKTERFYKQINAERNFLNIEMVDPNQIALRLNEIRTSKVVIPKKVVSSAKSNLVELERFINTNRKKRINE